MDKKIILIAIVAIAVVLIGAIALSGGNSDEKEKDNTPDSPSIPTIVPATSVIIVPGSIEITVGGTASAVATVNPTNSTDQIIWKSQDESIAKVSNGVVTGIAPGTTTVMASAGSVTGICTVVVKKFSVPATSVTLDRTSLNLSPAETATLTATVYPSNSTDQIQWDSQDERVAKVSNGVVTGIAPGTTTVMASAGSVTGICTVIVKEFSVPATSVTLDRTLLNLSPSETATLTATVSPKDSTEGVSWKTSDASICIVKDGKITALKSGKCIVTAIAGSESATCEVTVNDSITAGSLAALEEAKDSIKYSSL